MELRRMVSGDVPMWNRYIRVANETQAAANHLSGGGALDMVRSGELYSDGWLSLNDPVGTAVHDTDLARTFTKRARTAARALPRGAELRQPMFELEQSVVEAQRATRRITTEYGQHHFSSGSWKVEYWIDGAEEARASMRSAADSASLIAGDVRSMAAPFKPRYALTGTGKLAIAGGVVAALAGIGAITWAVTRD
jgi:hypothetical protein